MFSKIFLIASIGLTLILQVALAGDFVARLDRTQVVEGDPVVLTLAASGDVNGKPDLSALQQDFDLLSQGQSNRMSFVNGRTSSSHEWHLTLMPRRTGKITIPPITFGGSTSQPVVLEVLAADQAAQQGISRPVMLEVEVTPETPFVQQKLIYTVRLLHAVPLRDARLSEPRIDDALVYPLGNERRFETYRNGRKFQAVERRYAVMPQRSGTLEIGGPVLTARVSDPSQSQRGNSLRDRFFGGDPFAGLGNGFGSVFGQTRPLQVRAPDKSVDVSPQPPGAGQPWLPAESVDVTETWSPDPSQLRVGEPATRTIIISALGLADAQLPEPEPGVIDGANLYPDKTQAQTRADGDTLVAQKVVKYAVVPTRSGDVTLPALRIGWWDLASGTAQVAGLPARTLRVAPAVGGATRGAGNTAPAASNVPALPPPAGPKMQGSAAAGDAAAGSRVPPEGPAGPVPGGLWPWLAAVFAIAWLVVTVLWVRARRQPSGRPAQPDNTMPDAAARGDLARHVADVRHACQANDARAARQALLAWAAARWPGEPVAGLDALVQRLGTGMAPTFDALNANLYGTSPGGWDGDAAWQKLAPPLRAESATAPGKGPRRDEALPPLYPTT